jgi:methyl-accepting chemotaxis protein
MHDKKYHDDKEKIMRPINEFEKLMNERVAFGLEKAQKNSKLATTVFIIVSLFFGIIATIFILYSSNKILKKLFNIVKSIHSIFEKNQVLNNEFYTSIDNINKIITTQSDSVALAGNTSSEIQKIVTSTAEKIDLANNMSKDIEKNTNNGKAAMQKMLQAAEKIQEINLNMQKINTIIVEISQKALVINEIVSKTELLSLNASIEAARAGELGKGFSVVAEEVGNLANITGKSAKEIETLISHSLSEVNDILKITNEKTSESKVVTQDTNVIFNQIAEKIESITKIISVASELTENQVQEIKKSFVEIKNIENQTKKTEEISKKTKVTVESLRNNNVVLQNLIVEANSFIKYEK